MVNMGTALRNNFLNIISITLFIFALLGYAFLNHEYEMYSKSIEYRIEKFEITSSLAKYDIYNSVNNGEFIINYVDLKQ